MFAMTGENRHSRSAAGAIRNPVSGRVGTFSVPTGLQIPVNAYPPPISSQEKMVSTGRFYRTLYFGSDRDYVEFQTIINTIKIIL